MKISLLLAIGLLAACSSAGNDGDDVQNPACGDGLKQGAEQCDDGNLVNGDGCSGACMMESSGARCGDGAMANGEGCDDGNNLSGDGCSATCEPEVPAATGGTCAMPYVLTTTVNADGIDEGTGTGDTTASTDQVAEAACDGFDSGAGKDHVWKFTLAVPSDVVVMTDETTAFDSVIRVMTSPCDVTTEVVEYGTEDGCSDGEGAAEFLGFVRLMPGTYYIVVDGFEATDIGQYSFSYYAWPTTCGDGTVDELEFCDDGNTTANDGCNARCEEEEVSSGAVKPAPGDIVLNEFMAADNASDTNCDGATTNTFDEFVELVNVTAKTLDLEGVTIADSVVMRHTFAAGTELLPNQAIVVWGGGAPACPGVTNFAVASSGQLGLNDGGDSIVIKSADATPVDLVNMTFPAATANVSANLSPELTGTSYMLHNAMTGAAGAFSPGKRSTGAAF